VKNLEITQQWKKQKEIFEQKYIENLEFQLTTLKREKTLLWKGGITNKCNDLVLTQLQQEFEEYREVHKKEYRLLEVTIQD
jgi:hypothetical protein